jgi:hypothetical protein
MAVRTKHCLQAITTHSIPFARRTIWVNKILALFVGAGGVLGTAAYFHLPWFLAILSAGPIIFFALTERVEEVIPPKPVQDTSAYRASWQRYRELRCAYLRSWRWFGAAGLTLIVTMAFADKLPNALQIGVFALCLVAVIASFAVMYVNQVRWFRWPCPRCGCAFRGFWSRTWLPKNCVYCGLPREDSTKQQQANSR